MKEDADDWFPIQVKQTDKVGRPVVDAFVQQVALSSRFSRNTSGNCAMPNQSGAQLFENLI